MAHRYLFNGIVSYAAITAMSSSNKNHPGNPNFKDHFSSASDTYASARPGYPDSLFAYLSSVCEQHDMAWDCATGNGQAAVKLAAHFKSVIASDASAQQIRHAQPHPSVDYIVTRAEDSGIACNSIDLVTVAQALHWFALPAFSKEVGRTLKAGGVMAAWTYNLLTINPQLDALINHLYDTLLGPYWAAERRLVEEGYQSIDFPYPELKCPNFQMELNWNAGQLLDYLSTWSAVKARIADNRPDPLQEIKDRLFELWGDTQQCKRIEWPLAVRVWRNA